MKKSNLLYTVFLVTVLCLSIVFIRPTSAQVGGDPCNGTMCTEINCAFFGLLCDGVCQPLSAYGDCTYTSSVGDCMDTGCNSPNPYIN